MEASSAGEPVLPTTETEDAGGAGAKVTENQWKAMRDILDTVLAFREDDGHDPSKIFHKRVNRRNVPDYYDVIKEPIAFSNLKQKLADREYKTFEEFVRDCALIWHNAHTYNRPDAGAYQDASVLKELMEEGFAKLVKDDNVTADEIKWPELGEIPPVDEVPEEGEEEGEEDEDEEEEEEDEDEDDSNDEKPKRRRGASRPHRRSIVQSDRGDASKKGRGRPPKVDTPMEARIQNVLKGLRKLKNKEGLMIYSFEKLPERSAMPEYYEYIQKPMSVDQIKKSLKRKRYQTVDDFMRDVDLMFNNAKLFNEDDSQIHHDAVELQNEAHRLAKIEKGKADSEFVTEEGRKPRPEGLTHNGEVWKVGDWVHINNANDTAKPIVAQIFRTYEDGDGQEWVNACWYYRPDQTVHHFERHFYPMEVVKTSHYRDHPIDDVIDRCYVMFHTRFPKGRPRGLPPHTKVYVCEARYNEDKHTLNRIKTWASCLPDEMRDQDYEMDLFGDGPRPNKRVPSPLVYMLQQGNVTEEAPQPKWGEMNAPPIVGGIYKGPREENQSPPPGASPSPAPQTIAQSRPAAAPGEDPWGKANEHFKKISETFGEPAAVGTRESPQRRSYTPQPYKQPSATPGGAPPTAYSTAPTLYAQPPQASAPPSAGTAASSTFIDQYSTPHRPSMSTNQSQSAAAAHMQQQRYAPMPGLPGGRQADAFILNDLVNSQIPETVREQFLQDETGHVLFFTKPPLATLPPQRSTKLGGHTIPYMAAKMRRKLEAKMQREHADENENENENKPGTANHDTTMDNTDQESAATPALKRRRLNQDKVNTTPNGTYQPHEGDPLQQAQDASFAMFIAEMDAGTAALLKAMQPGTGADALVQANEAKMAAQQAQAAAERELHERSKRKRALEREERARALWAEPDVYLDDVDPRLLRY